jgi:hypothetical protein
MTLGISTVELAPPPTSSLPECSEVVEADGDALRNARGQPE